MPDQKQGPFTMSGCEGKRSLCMCVSLSLSVGLSSSLSLSLSLSLRMSQRPAHDGHSGIIKQCVSCKGRQREGRKPEKSNSFERQGVVEMQRDREHPPHTEEVSSHLLPLRLHLLASLMTQRLRCVHRSEGPHPLTWGWKVVARG